MATDWNKLKVVDLKAELKRRDLPQNGLKAELVSRLQSDDDDQMAPDEAAAQVSHDESTEEQAQPSAAPPVSEVEDEKAVLEHNNREELDEVAATVHVPERDLNSLGKAASNQNPETEPDTHDGDAAAESLPFPETEESIDQTTSTPAVETLTSVPQSEEPVEEAPPELQKRKRRSASPPPPEEAVSKRMRVEEAQDTQNETHANVSPPNDSETLRESDRMDTTDAEVEVAQRASEAQKSGGQSPRDEDEDEAQHSDIDRIVPPAKHTTTSALYIANLMRPMRPADLQTHIIDLATPRSASLRNDVIVNFYLDTVKTHAFVVFATKSAAVRVRTLLHDNVWPNESNRKALFVDFVHPNRVEGWIAEETSQEVPRGTRWEITYTKEGEALLQTTTVLSRAAAGPPVGPSGDRRAPPPSTLGGANSIPVGPRNFLREPPTGPRPKNSGPGPRPPPRSYNNSALDSRATRANPPISVQPVSEELARRRLSNMRSYYKPGVSRRDTGREYNRYSFQQGDTFVDRGKEVFEGIRPPHRERAMRGGRGRRGGGGHGYGGGPPMRGRRGGDSYVPGGGGGGRHGYGRDNRR